MESCRFQMLALAFLTKNLFAKRSLIDGCFAPTSQMYPAEWLGPEGETASVGAGEFTSGMIKENDLGLDTAAQVVWIGNGAGVDGPSQEVATALPPLRVQRVLPRTNGSRSMESGISTWLEAIARVCPNQCRSQLYRSCPCLDSFFTSSSVLIGLFAEVPSPSSTGSLSQEACDSPKVSFGPGPSPTSETQRKIPSGISNISPPVGASQTLGSGQLRRRSPVHGAFLIQAAVWAPSMGERDIIFEAFGGVLRSQRRQRPLRWPRQAGRELPACRRLCGAPNRDQLFE